MKKSIKSGMVAAVVVAAGFAAYQSYGSYGAQDNSLLMQNVEALADDKNGEPGGDPNGDGNNDVTYRAVKCFKEKATDGIESLICPDGTNPPDYKACPSETETVNPLSNNTSRCIKVL